MVIKNDELKHLLALFKTENIFGISRKTVRKKRQEVKNLGGLLIMRKEKQEKEQMERFVRNNKLVDQFDELIIPSLKKLPVKGKRATIRKKNIIYAVERIILVFKTGEKL